MAKMVMPLAELERRPDDQELSAEQFLEISLFAQLKKKPSVDKYPGAVVLRQFRRGEVICRQGQPGWTAFYILTTADMLRVRKMQGAPESELGELQRRDQQLVVAREADERLAQIQREAAGQGDRELARTLRELTSASAAVKRQHAERLAATRPELAELINVSALGRELRQIATVYLLLPRPTPPGREGFLGRLKARLLGHPARSGQSPPPALIPIDGPADIDYETCRQAMYEGDLFGEMSCLNRTPRSATIVADRDCYTLEILRSLLDQVRKDPAYKQQMDDIYRQRVLAMHLRKLPIFSGLTEEQLEQVHDRVELVRAEPGTVLFDEHDRSDSMYVIRNGMVKVVKNV